MIGGFDIRTPAGQLYVSANKKYTINPETRRRPVDGAYSKIAVVKAKEENAGAFRVPIQYLERGAILSPEGLRHLRIVDDAPIFLGYHGLFLICNIARHLYYRCG